MWRRLPLVACLTLIIPTIVLADIADFAPPPATAPFDDVDEATLQAEVTRQAFAFLDTLQRHWGEGPDRLRTVVDGPVERADEGTLLYLRTLQEHGVLEGYEFRQGSLARGRYLLLQGPLNGLNEFIGYYAALKQALNTAYGEPEFDRVVWDNDLYAPMPEYWGVAVMIGHLHYHAAWETTEGRLTLDLSGNRYSRLSLEYRVRREATDT
jgi:hypothetical protein